MRTRSTRRSNGRSIAAPVAVRHTGTRGAGMPRHRARSPLAEVALSRKRRTRGSKPVYPHDTAAFTEGIELFEGKLYESTGLTGRSTVRRGTVTTGVSKKHDSIPPSSGRTHAQSPTLINLMYHPYRIVFDLDTSRS